MNYQGEGADDNVALAERHLGQKLGIEDYKKYTEVARDIDYLMEIRSLHKDIII